MNEVDFEIILDAVRTAIAAPKEKAMLAYRPILNAPPVAANDNNKAWPLLPFPEGWYAAC